MPELLMPALGADMESGVLVEWRIGVGARVQRGDIIAVVETDKGQIEIEAYAEGVVSELVGSTGERIPVGMPIALLDGAAAGAEKRVPASPAARREAARQGVDLASVVGTGPHGAVQLEDVQLGAVEPSGGGPSEERMDSLRRSVGRLMSLSKRTVPHFYLQLATPVDAAVEHLARLNADRPPEDRVVMTALVIRAISQACVVVPEMSGYYEDGRFAPEPEVRVGLAVAMRGGGVIAPALPAVDEASIDEVSLRMRALVRRAREGRLLSSEAAGGSITLSSLGQRSADVVHGTVYPPQVALVGMGSVEARAWPRGDRVEVRSVVGLSLAADHRVSNGRRGGRFLREVANLLDHPERL